MADETKKKKGGCLKTVIIVVIVLAVLGALFGGGGDKEQPKTDTTQTTQAQTVDPQPTKDESSAVVEDEVAQEPAESAEPAAPEMTMGQKNALKSAQSYLDFAAFSRSGLIEQLEFEGYSTEDATYAVDNCGADWNEQAAKSAESYLEFSSFSRDGLIEQLEFEGFTHDQAVYGVTQVGY